MSKQGSGLTLVSHELASLLHTHRCPPKEMTHLSLDGAFGGVFKFEPAELDKLRSLLSEAHAQQARFFLNELNGPHRTFSIDVDLTSLRSSMARKEPSRKRNRGEFEEEDKKAWQEEFASEMRDLVRAINEVIFLYYGHRYPKDSVLYESLVQARDPDFEGVKPEGAAKLTSSDARQDRVPCSEGARICYPNLVVNRDQSVQMHAHIVQVLKTKNGLLPHSLKEWEVLIDPLIYEPNAGLRFFGSSKAKPCGCKKGKCPKCLDLGKLDMGRIYNRILFCSDFEGRDLEGKREAYENDLIRLYRDTSLRRDCSKVTDGYRVHPTAPASTEIKRFDSRTPASRLSGRASDPEKKIYNPDPYPLKEVKGTMSRFEPDEVQRNCLLRAIRRMNPLYYGQLDLLQCSREAKGNLIRVQVQGPGCHYCHNIQFEDESGRLVEGGRHNSHAIHFDIDPSQVSQGCSDPCSCPPKKRVNKNPCNRYRTRKIKTQDLPAEEARILFPSLCLSSRDASEGPVLQYLDCTALSVSTRDGMMACMAYQTQYAAALARRIERRTAGLGKQ